jgi:hypothetical protein
MKCKKPNCNGDVVNGTCQICGSSAGGDQTERTAEPKISEVTAASEQAAKETMLRDQNKEDLERRAIALEKTVPDDFHSWRSQADLLLSAIRQLEIRQILPDESVKLIGVPLRESALRDAAENALRNCAHFAQTFDERVTLIDEANRIRATTWF